MRTNKCQTHTSARNRKFILYDDDGQSAHFLNAERTFQWKWNFELHSLSWLFPFWNLRCSLTWNCRWKWQRTTINPRFNHVRSFAFCPLESTKLCHHSKVQVLFKYRREHYFFKTTSCYSVTHTNWLWSLCHWGCTKMTSHNQSNHLNIGWVLVTSLLNSLMTVNIIQWRLLWIVPLMSAFHEYLKRTSLRVTIIVVLNILYFDLVRSNIHDKILSFVRRRGLHCQRRKFQQNDVFSWNDSETKFGFLCSKSLD